MTGDAGSLAFTSVWLFLVWILVFLCWRQYRIDSFRQRLFALRDELYDYAAAGGIAFDSPAYTSLRISLNQMIRFAHKVNVPYAMLAFAIQRGDPNKYEQIRRLLEHVQALPDGEAKDKLLGYHGRMLGLMVRHMVTGSPTLVLVLLVMVLSVLSEHTARGVADVCRQALSRLADGMRPRIEPLENIAYESEL